MRARKPAQFKGWRELFVESPTTRVDARIQLALQSLPNESSGPSSKQVARLGELVDGDLPLQSFLEQLLPHLCTLFGGSAAVAWMKAHGSSDAVFGVRYQMDKLLTAVTEQKKHERLVQLAWQQRQPMLAESPSQQAKNIQWLPSDTAPGVGSQSSQPTGSPTQEAFNSSHNTTGHPLLFGPILHLGEPIALLEIVLSASGQPLTVPQRQLYLRSVKLVSERVYGGLRRRMAMPAASIEKAVAQIEQLGGDIESLHLQIRQRIEARLQYFHGWAFASLAENQAFAKMVHQLLESHGLRVVCPECGHPAILRCLRVGNAKHGAFVFDHYLDTGRTFHGGPTTVPLIRVIGKPARRPALSNPA